MKPRAALESRARGSGSEGPMHVARLPLAKDLGRVDGNRGGRPGNGVAQVIEPGKGHAPIADGSYRADVDGLRGVAGLAVILFHIHADWGRGGFAGVDVFFAISGFLLTRNILAELDDGSFSVTWSSRLWIERPARRSNARLGRIVLLQWALPSLGVAGFALLAMLTGGEGLRLFSPDRASRLARFWEESAPAVWQGLACDRELLTENDRSDAPRSKATRPDSFRPTGSRTASPQTGSFAAASRTFLSS
jgi:hypothetical protein